jgi:hypothetical protein
MRFTGDVGQAKIRKNLPKDIVLKIFDQKEWYQIN